MPPVQYHLGKFPPTDVDWEYLSPVITRAGIELGRYDGVLSAIPEAELLLSPLKTKEAVLSSRIEGTRVTMSEVLEIEAGGGSNVSQSKRDDTEEIINYRETLKNCAEEIKIRPISQQMIRAAHGELMKSVRGKDKYPGQYRTEQNWIGEKGCSIEGAGFVPIATEYLIDGMEAWEKYLQRDNSTNPIAKLAIIHVEFEALHPFLDGNGRLGRMLIPLFFYQQKILDSPSFYMSGYLEKNRDEYQEKMRAVSKNGEWTAWIEFFAKGVEEQAKENTRKARDILNYYNIMKEKISDATRSQYGIKALDFIFQRVYFSTSTFCAYSGIPEQTAKALLQKMVASGIIIEARKGRGRAPSMYWFQGLTKITDPEFVNII